jgi:hypothetical protein
MKETRSLCPPQRGVGLQEPNLGKNKSVCHTLYLLAICFAPSLSDSLLFLTLTRLVVVIKFVNFRFALFTPSRRLSRPILLPLPDTQGETRVPGEEGGAGGRRWQGVVAGGGGRVADGARQGGGPARAEMLWHGRGGEAEAAAPRRIVAGGGPRCAGGRSERSAEQVAIVAIRVRRRPILLPLPDTQGGDEGSVDLRRRVHVRGGGHP